MDKENIERVLSEIISTTLGRDDIVLSRDMKATDVPEWNSLNHIRIILACEEKFGIRLNARIVNSLNSVGDMIDTLSEKVNRNARN